MESEILCLGGFLKLWDYIYSLLELNCENGVNEYNECYWVFVWVDLIIFVYIYFILNILVKVNIFIY